MIHNGAHETLPLLALLVLLALAATASGDDDDGLHVWTAETGHKLKARFLNTDGEMLRLVKPDGKVVRVKLSVLIDADRKLALELSARSDLFAALKPAPVKLDSWLEARVGGMPDDKEFNAFYQQHTSLQGLPIIASGKVRPEALKVAHRWVQLMASERPELLRELVLNDVRLAVIGRQEVTTDIPEYQALTPADYWNQKTRGISADQNRRVVSAAEENLLLLKDDSYQGEQVLVHEFAHTLHQVALPRLEPDFDERLKSLYLEAMKNGLWQKTHAATNRREYFAEGVQSWFNVNRESERPDGVHGPVNTRDELKKYDPGLAELIDSVFP